MNCTDIQEQDIIGRYAAGRLSAGEEQEFEGHLVDCSRCLDALEGDTGLRTGLRLAAPEFAARLDTPEAPPAVRRWSLPAAFLQMAAALLLTVSVGLGAWLSRTSGDLSAVRAERDELQRKVGQSEQSSAALEQRLAALERSADAGRAAAIVPAAVFALTTVRGSAADAGPVNRITIDPAFTLVVFSLDLPGATGSADYTVSVNDQTGRNLWTGDTFPASTPDSLSVAVDAKLLPAGDYLLELQQRSPQGRLVLIGRYPFRVATR